MYVWNNSPARPALKRYASGLCFDPRHGDNNAGNFDKSRYLWVKNGRYFTIFQGIFSTFLLKISPTLASIILTEQHKFTWSELSFLTDSGLPSDCRVTWIGSTSPSPSGLNWNITEWQNIGNKVASKGFYLGAVTSSATSVAASSNKGSTSVGCLYNLSARDSSKLQKMSWSWSFD